MPLYQQIVVALPKFPNQALVEVFKKYSGIILSNGGVIRGIENHGIRPLAEQAKRKYATTDGSRYFWEARFITVTFDAAPKVLVLTDRYFRTQAGILRTFVVKQRAGMDIIKDNSFRNPHSGKTVE
jgi:ribosomal protein S6